MILEETVFGEEFGKSVYYLNLVVLQGVFLEVEQSSLDDFEHGLEVFHFSLVYGWFFVVKLGFRLVEVFWVVEELLKNPKVLELDVGQVCVIWGTFLLKGSLSVIDLFLGA